MVNLVGMEVRQLVEEEQRRAKYIDKSMKKWGLDLNRDIY
jgi:hypothetical protein